MTVYRHPGDQSAVALPDGSTAGVVSADIREKSNIMTAGTAVSGGTTSHLFQLWNPANSGVNLIVQYGLFQSAAAGNVQMWNTDAALTTQITGESGNQDFSGAAPLAEIYSDIDVLETGTNLGRFRVSANVLHELWVLNGIKITPGTGLTLRSISGGAIYPTIKWQEVSV